MFMSSFQLNNKTLLITGATSGIGKASVKKIIEHGGKVIITGRNQEKLDQMKNNHPLAIKEAIICDFLNLDEIKNLAKKVDKVNGVVHCIGCVSPYPIRYLSKIKVDETMDVNYHSAVNLIAQLDQNKKLENEASLVFLSSISAAHPHKGGTAYSSSKAALESFSKVIAK